MPSILESSTADSMVNVIDYLTKPSRIHAKPVFDVNEKRNSENCDIYH